MKSIEVASNFIIDVITNPCIKSTGDRLYTYIAKVNRKFNKEQLSYFKEVLETGMIDEINAYGETELKTEYLPIGVLRESLLVTDMPLNIFPLNMDVKVNRNSVKVQVGINKPYEEIYNGNEKCLRKTR